MGETGLLSEDNRMEFIDGEVVQMSRATVATTQEGRST